VNPSWLSRTELLMGEEALSKLQKHHVAVVGLGGIGGFAVECLARAGIGEFTLVDGDHIEETNRNRQVIALCSNDGKRKVEELKQRVLDINPEAVVHARDAFMTPETLTELHLEKAEVILDCIDTLTPKTQLIAYARENQIPILSCLGAGGKFDPSRVRVTDLSRTHHCTLARAVRKRLYKMGIRKNIPVIFSPEPVDKSRLLRTDGSNFKKSSLGTISYMPPLFGLYASSVIIREFLGIGPSRLKLHKANT